MEDERLAQLDRLPVWPNGGPPVDLTMRVTEGVRLMVFRIPRHCRRR